MLLTWRRRVEERDWGLSAKLDVIEEKANPEYGA
jgi:hypothetical protein